MHAVYSRNNVERATHISRSFATRNQCHLPPKSAEPPFQCRVQAYHLRPKLFRLCLLAFTSGRKSSQTIASSMRVCLLAMIQKASVTGRHRRRMDEPKRDPVAILVPP